VTCVRHVRTTHISYLGTRRVYTSPGPKTREATPDHGAAATKALTATDRDRQTNAGQGRSEGGGWPKGTQATRARGPRLSQPHPLTLDLTLTLLRTLHVRLFALLSCANASS